jgi:hypothetical protein
MKDKRIISKNAKKRSSQYEPKLKINATFDEAMKMMVGGNIINEPNLKITNKKK